MKNPSRNFLKAWCFYFFSFKMNHPFHCCCWCFWNTKEGRGGRGTSTAMKPHPPSPCYFDSKVMHKLTNALLTLVPSCPMHFHTIWKEHYFGFWLIKYQKPRSFSPAVRPTIRLKCFPRFSFPFVRTSHKMIHLYAPSFNDDCFVIDWWLIDWFIQFW